MRTLFTNCVLALLLLGFLTAPAAHAQGFQSAAATIDITPAKPAYLAGYAIARKSDSVHDRLTARCLVVDDGKTRLAFVSCDLIGIPRFNTLLIRSQIKNVPASQVMIGGTHTHSGPDTLGMWGPTLTVSGVDKPWLEETCTRIAKMVDSAAAALKPAGVRFGSVGGLKHVSKNIRVKEILDTTLSTMQVVGLSDHKPICTLVNYACHPEILNNRQMTADFPHWLYEAVEKVQGGTCIYFNGAQGGMVTADFDESLAPKGNCWPEAERIGTQLGEAANRALADAAIVTNLPISFTSRVFNVPLANRRYRALINMKVFSGSLQPDGSVQTEAACYKIGPAEFITIPGEALPNVGLYLRRHMQGTPTFQFGLTNDFLGYILAPEDFGLDLYGYESGQSVGPDIEPILTRNLFEMMDSKRAARL
jgi:Neutral/alkaline non-lysosomal ceramidase, N-terminal